MNFSGKTFVQLPQVEKFSFAIQNLLISNLNPVSFTFFDKNSNLFSFLFSGGFVFTDKIIYTYNNKDFYQINGYFENSNFKYKIDKLFGNYEKNFGKLNGLLISSENSLVSCDLLFNSNPINYELNFNSSYNWSGILTGNFYSDTQFNINNYSFKYLNSENNLLSPEKLTSTIYEGNNLITFKDIDDSDLEYNNSFLIYADTIFNQLNFNKNSYRTNLYSKNFVNIDENPINNYTGSCLFNGIWSGNNFIYSGDSAEINVSFNLANFDYFGNENEKTYGYVVFADRIDYTRFENITGFKLTNSGLYSGKEPSLRFSRYYYVEGINQNFQDLLFSSGCPERLRISFPEDNENYDLAEGFLEMRDVYVNNFYGNGINKFKSVFNYTPISLGRGYTGVPMVYWGTGNNCFSIPDVYGESGQFKKIDNTLAKAKTYADYLTGLSLTSGITGQNGVVTGYIVTGIKITNIGSGYNQVFPGKVYFERSSEDLLNNDASGIFYHKNIKNISLPPLQVSKNLTFVKDTNAFYNGSITTGFSFSVRGYKDIENERIFSIPITYSGIYESEDNVNYYLNFGWQPNSNYDGYLFLVDQKLSLDKDTNQIIIQNGDPYFTNNSYAAYGAFITGTGIEIGKNQGTSFITETNNTYQFIDAIKYQILDTVYNKSYTNEEIDLIIKNCYKVSYNFTGTGQNYLSYRNFPYSYFYSYFEKPYGENNINIKIKQNLDNNDPLLGFLVLGINNKPFDIFSNNFKIEKVLVKKLEFNKNFNTSTGALI